MSRIGNTPIELPKDVEVTMSEGTVAAKGPKGNFSINLPKTIEVEKEDSILNVKLARKRASLSPLHGTFRALIANMVHGVTEGWKRSLELVGTGYRAEVKGNTLVLTIGYSHPVELAIPEGITVSVEKNIINIEGVDKNSVGQFAANTRAARPPEPYKGKGIKYSDEVVRRKAGKAAKTEGA